MDLNRAQIIGNVTRDPELRTTATGQNVCSFGIATNQQWTDAQGAKQQRTEFHNLVAWGKLAELCSQYMTKGRKVFVEGRLQTREWEAQDGAKRTRTEIVLDNMILLDRPPAGTTSPRPLNEPTVTQIPSTPMSPPAGGPAAALDKGMGEQEIRVEDIPF